MLDPRDDDRREFIRWVLKATKLGTDDLKVLEEQLDDIYLAHDYSAAAFVALRSQIKAEQPADHDAVLNIVRDIIPPAIGLTRRYQTLQALVNCTRRSLLPDSDTENATREDWEKELRELERQGIS